jgi:hypothetical protein
MYLIDEGFSLPEKATFEQLAQQLATAFDTFMSSEKNRLAAGTEELYTIVQKMVEFRAVRHDNMPAYRKFLRDRGVKHSEAKDDKPLLLVKALVPKSLWQSEIARISFYGLAIEGIEFAGVKPSMVKDWLSISEDVFGDGTPISGMNKAKAYHRLKVAQANNLTLLKGKVVRSNPYQRKFFRVYEDETPKKFVSGKLKDIFYYIARETDDGRIDLLRQSFEQTDDGKYKKPDWLILN